MLKEKILLTIICIYCINTVFCQLSVELIFGTRIHTDRMESVNFAGPPKVITSLVTGLELSHSKISNVNLSYQKSYIQFFTNFAGSNLMAVEQFGPISEIFEEDQIHLYYNLKKYRFGIGHYWRKRENSDTFLFSDARFSKRKGFQLSFTLPIQWIDVEFRTKVQYDPGFSAIFGTAHYALLLTKKIGLTKNKKGANTGFVTVHGLLGVRSFLIDIDLLPGEALNKPIAIAPALGLEFLLPRYNLSINLEKDWWNSFNGGSTTRPVKGLVYSSFIGIKYHQELRNGKNLRYGIGGSWIEDNENKLNNITINPTPVQQRLGNFQVKGIGISISYEIFSNVDFEIKTTIPVIGEKIFENSSRNSIGLIYRYNPLRKYSSEL